MCLITNFESPKIEIISILNSSKAFNPKISSSYSTTSFVVSNSILYEKLMISSEGEIDTIPYPDPSFVMEPSKFIFHILSCTTSTYLFTILFTLNSQFSSLSFDCKKHDPIYSFTA